MNVRKFLTSNGWWGKCIGALLGYLSAGPIGSLLGLLLGNFVDKNFAEHFASPHLLYHAEKQQQRQKVFFESTFLVMGHMAKADGHVSTEEIQMAKTLMDEMKLNKTQKVQAKHLFTEGKQKTFKLDTVLYLLQRTCHDNRELLKLFIDIQYRAAQVDGLSAPKVKVLNNILSYLGFAPLHEQHRFYEEFNYTKSNTNSQSSSQKNSQYQQPYKSPENQLSYAYSLLEVNSQANKQEVKKAYRRLLSKNHPDKLIAQGLPDAMIKMANDKTHKIMQAYELICQSKGW